MRRLLRVRRLFGCKEAYLAVLLFLGYAALQGESFALIAFVAVSALCIARAGQ